MKIHRCPDEIIVMEKMLHRRRELNNILLNLDMYERWGYNNDPAMNKEQLL